MRLLFLLMSLESVGHADEFKRSTITDQYWIETAAALSPDSSLFQGEPSAVGRRRELSLRYQPGIFGLLVNWHVVKADSELEQEAFDLYNSIFGAGFSMRVAPFGESGGALGGAHFLVHVIAQYGSSKFHYFEGPAQGAKAEVKAGIPKASGFGAGIDFLFPAFFGVWLTGGGGFESNSFRYDITSDPNGDGKVNIRQTFTFVRVGLSYSI